MYVGKFVNHRNISFDELISSNIQVASQQFENANNICSTKLSDTIIPLHMYFNTSILCNQRMPFVSE